MGSSTSSFEPRSPGGPPPTTLPQALGRVIVALGPPAGAALVLVLTAAALAARLPAPATDEDMANLVVGAQMRRAERLGPADLLVLGDSSGLMGVDAARMERPLGRRVQSLATVGYVGPAGYARMLDRVATHTTERPQVLLLLSPVSLAIDEAGFATKGLGLETKVLAGPTVAPRESEVRPVELIYARLFAPLIRAPMPGRLGFHYGWPEDVARALDDGHGTLIDPNRFEEASVQRPTRFEVTPAVEARMRVLAVALRAHARAPLFAFTPIPQRAVGADTEATRAAARDRILALLGLPDSAYLALPTALPGSLFATSFHLDATGRQHFTELLVAELRKAAALR
jgi:hypothetical protein